MHQLTVLFALCVETIEYTTNTSVEHHFDDNDDDENNIHPFNGNYNDHGSRYSVSSSSSSSSSMQ